MRGLVMNAEMNSANFEGKVAIVTGAASGIGEATAMMFGRRGATVVVADRNRAAGETCAATIREFAGKAVFVYADVSRSSDVELLMSNVEGRFGGLDILVNNAAVQIMGTLTETSEVDWDTMHSVNLKGVFLGCKYAIPIMLRKGKGVIVNVASVLGIVGDPDLAAYCAAKGGILALTRAAALEYGPKGVRLNSICPGDVDTDMVKEFLNAKADPVAAREAINASYALRRIASPDEVARCIGFLASDESSFMTGATLIVDGGLTVKCY
jgi:NAD(P)-dependent dehydrogenase (short-subunit alcohol dehydrogenase family)